MSMYSPSGSGQVHVDKILKKADDVPYEIRMTGAKHCVYKKGTDQKIGCHDTHEEAQSQMAALYANEGKGMSENHYTYLVNLDAVTLAEQDGVNTSWVHALPIGKFQHPVYGTMDITSSRAAKFAESVNTKVRGIEPSINYTHNNEGEAAGWVKKAEARSDGLWLFVEWVSSAAQKIREKAFRYFSAEIADKWKDPNGKIFDDVVFGGGLTNRPFMKNLVPINLSEATVDNAFELVSTITGTPLEDLKGTKGNDMELSEAQLKGIIEGVTTKLAEQLKPATPPSNDPTPPALSEIAELKQLAEDNPTVKALLYHFEQQGKNLHETSKDLRETQVQAKLAEFDNSQLTLTPSAKELLHGIMTDPSMTKDLSEKMWALMEQVRKSQGFLVELGERSGASVRYGHGLVEKSATQEFTERINKLIAEDKMDFLAASERVAKEDPALFERYRQGDGAKTTA